jgi:hypothetical protein
MPGSTSLVDAIQFSGWLSGLPVPREQMLRMLVYVM